MIDAFLVALPLALTFAAGLYLTDLGDAQQSMQRVLRVAPWWAALYVSSEVLFGWTLGKRAIGLVIRSVDGSRASGGALVVRCAAKYIWFLIAPMTTVFAPALTPHVATPAWLIAFGAFFLAGRPSRQALWDVIARTAVFRAAGDSYRAVGGHTPGTS